MLNWFEYRVKAIVMPFFKADFHLALWGMPPYTCSMRILFILFVLVPLAELYVLIEVGSSIGGLTTIGLCLLTAAIGGILIRIQGIQTLLKARQSMRQYELAEQGLHGVMLVLAGVLLFTPGFITDVLGFLLLVPALRRYFIYHVYLPKASHGGQVNHRYSGVEVIDVEVVREEHKR